MVVAWARIYLRRREVTNLITKEQLLTVASVAVAFFLLGSMLIGGLIATGKSKDKDEDLWNAISELQARVETFEEQSLPQGFIPAPAYDSGWISIPQGDTIIFHGLGTTGVLVNLVGYDTETWGIHHLALRNRLLPTLGRTLVSSQRRFH